MLACTPQIMCGKLHLICVFLDQNSLKIAWSEGPNSRTFPSGVSGMTSLFDQGIGTVPRGFSNHTSDVTFIFTPSRERRGRLVVAIWDSFNTFWRARLPICRIIEGKDFNVVYKTSFPRETFVCTRTQHGKPRSSHVVDDCRPARCVWIKFGHIWNFS